MHPTANTSHLPVSQSQQSQSLWTDMRYIQNVHDQFSRFQNVNIVLYYDPEHLQKGEINLPYAWEILGNPNQCG